MLAYHNGAALGIKVVLMVRRECSLLPISFMAIFLCETFRVQMEYQFCYNNLYIPKSIAFFLISI
jgi:hypothetical protein